MYYLHEYITLQEIFGKKSCEDVEAKFGMAEPLLEDQGKDEFIRFKNTMIKGLVASVGTDSVATPREITEDSLKKAAI